jgi:hypothetical protein
MQNPENVTNPGSVNVADQGDGLTVVDQAVTVSPSYNPGPVVATGSEGFGVGDADPDQPVKVGPSSNPGPLVHADAEGFGVGEAGPNQPVTVGPSQSSASAQTASSQPGETVEPGLTNAGTYSPMGPDVLNVTQNNVAGQVYGVGTPQNVFV